MPPSFTFYMAPPTERELDLAAYNAGARWRLGAEPGVELRDPARAVAPAWRGFEMHPTAEHPLDEAMRRIVRVIMRPPTMGERGWWVHARTADEALAEVLATDAVGHDGVIGWEAPHDHDAEPDDEGMIAITVECMFPPDPTIEEIRARLAARPRDPEDGEICEDPACPGWDVFEMNGQIRQRTPAESPDNIHEIQRCDICCPEGLSDFDLARLPEAQAALALACEAPEPRPVYVTIRVMTDAALRDVEAIVHACIRSADDFTVMDDAIRVSEVAP